MTNQITGKIMVIGHTASIPSKDGSKTYNKREIILDATKFDPYTGERGYENYPSFEFGGDKCAELDQFSVGEIVTISFDLQGTKYEKDGQTRFFTRIRGYKVERRHVQNASTQTPQYTQSQDNDMPF
jgi:hypothetical protein